MASILRDSINSELWSFPVWKWSSYVQVALGKMADSGKRKENLLYFDGWSSIERVCLLFLLFFLLGKFFLCMRVVRLLQTVIVDSSTG